MRVVSSFNLRNILIQKTFYLGFLILLAVPRTVLSQYPILGNVVEKGVGQSLLETYEL